MNIKEKIRAIRESKGISVAFVADKIGMVRSNYSRFERATEDKAYIETIEAICDALGITLYDLISYGEPAISSEVSALVKEIEKLRMEKMQLQDELMRIQKEAVKMLLLATQLAVVMTEIGKKEAKGAVKADDISDFLKDFIPAYLNGEGSKEDLRSPLVAMFFTPEQAAQIITEELPRLVFASFENSKQKQQKAGTQQ